MNIRKKLEFYILPNKKGYCIIINIGEDEYEK